jgi:hypothetical protein
MPLKLNKRCKICQVIEGGDAELMRRIYGSSRFKTGGETLHQIAKDYEGTFLYASLTVHAKNHQYISEKDLKRSTLNKLASAQANRAVLATIKHGDVRGLVMEKGYKQIKSGKIKLKASDVIKAAKDEADIELKQKDQSIEVMKMMEKFMSGELQAQPDEHADALEGEVIPQ